MRTLGSEAMSLFTALALFATIALAPITISFV